MQTQDQTKEPSLVQYVAIHSCYLLEVFGSLEPALINFKYENLILEPGTIFRNFLLMKQKAAMLHHDKK